MNTVNNFANAIHEETSHTYTENGARAKNTTGSACLDFFSSIGALRNADLDRKIRLFEAAYEEDPLTAVRTLVYGRDILKGLGERETFRQLYSYAANNHPEIVRWNNRKIPFYGYGRWDDLYCLIGTDCEKVLWKAISDQFEEDWVNHTKGKTLNISLLAKWLKRGDESSKNAKALGILTAQKLGYSVAEWKRKVAALRRDLDIVEAKMSTNRWGEINYPGVPSRAAMIYRKAFYNHDPERYAEYLQKVKTGKAKINTGTLYPYDILEKALDWRSKEPTDTIQVLWDNLPDYVDGKYNALVIADTSGSMTGRPLNTAISLAIYFAQHNRGAYHNLWMTFSEHPHYQKIVGKDLKKILGNMNFDDWGMSTNLEAAFEMVLNTAINNHVAPDEIPASLIVISDMEINRCEHSGWSFYDEMERRYAQCGYKIPNVVFWNVESRHDVFHADSIRRGVQLVSGQSASTFTTLMNSIGMTPFEYMMATVHSERYKLITL